MATAAQPTLSTRTVTPLAHWHLLSLDAPTVAALWTWFLARANRILLPIASPAAMFLAVWILYAADRLLDARVLETQPFESGLEARHLFHHRHRSAFMAGIAAAATILAGLLPRLEPAAIRLYLTEGALLVAWFLILHATRSAHRLPKEIAVGLFFAAATFIPTVARQPALRLALLPDALLFAALCSLNCLFIYAWEHEHEGRAVGPEPHASTRLALGHLRALAIATALLASTLGFLGHGPASIPVACAVSVGILFLLHQARHRIPGTPLRASADLALLTPIVFLAFAR